MVALAGKGINSGHFFLAFTAFFALGFTLCFFSSFTGLTAAFLATLFFAVFGFFAAERVLACIDFTADLAAAMRATGTLNGEQLT
jgi:hypothetical protein